MATESSLPEESSASCSTSATTLEKAEVMKNAADLLAQGKRNMVCGEIPKAVSLFEEAVQLLVGECGELSRDCADAYFSCGSALLELGRMETNVLGAALEGVEVEEEKEEEASEQFEKPPADEGEERQKLREEVYEAMAEGEREEEYKKALVKKKCQEQGVLVQNDKDVKDKNDTRDIKQVSDTEMESEPKDADQNGENPQSKTVAKKVGECGDVSENNEGDKLISNCVSDHHEIKKAEKDEKLKNGYEGNEADSQSEKMEVCTDFQCDKIMLSKCAHAVIAFEGETEMGVLRDNGAFENSDSGTKVNNKSDDNQGKKETEEKGNSEVRECQLQTQITSNADENKREASGGKCNQSGKLHEEKGESEDIKTSLGNKAEKGESEDEIKAKCTGNKASEYNIEKELESDENKGYNSNSVKVDGKEASSKENSKAELNKNDDGAIAVNMVDKCAESDQTKDKNPTASGNSEKQSESEIREKNGEQDVNKEEKAAGSEQIKKEGEKKEEKSQLDKGNGKVQKTEPSIEADETEQARCNAQEKSEVSEVKQSDSNEGKGGAIKSKDGKDENKPENCGDSESKPSEDMESETSNENMESKEAEATESKDNVLQCDSKKSSQEDDDVEMAEDGIVYNEIYVTLKKLQY